MTKSKITEIFKRLDDEKFTLLQHGVGFDFILKDLKSTQFLHTGIGQAQDMVDMQIFSLVSMYMSFCRSGAEASIDDFMDEIKKAAVKAYNSDAFNLGFIDEMGEDK